MLAQAAALVVSVVLLFLIWWNLVKLVLECAERYIICVFTILLSPLAFATATNERTKDTAINWMQMFWSQCVLLILNIWVVGIARTALDIGLVGASIDSVVKWGLITYAYLKIAQKLDDLLAKAGFRITSTTGLDPMSEAIGAFSVLKPAHTIFFLLRVVLPVEAVLLLKRLARLSVERTTARRLPQISDACGAWRRTERELE